MALTKPSLKMIKEWIAEGLRVGTHLLVTGNATIDGVMKAYSSVAPYASVTVEGSSTNAAGITLNNTIASGKKWMVLSSGGQNGTTLVGSLVIWNETATNRVAMVIDGTSGYVGIARAAPTAMLDVNGTLAVSGKATFNDVVQLNAARTQISTFDGAGSHWFMVDTTEATTFLGFARGTDGKIKTVTITPNLGIGTTEPTAKLHVMGDARIEGLLFGKSPFVGRGLVLGAPLFPTDANAQASFIIHNYENTTDWSGIGGYTNGGMFARASEFQFWSPSYSSNTPLLSLSANGRVGIGTTAPSSSLTVLGTNQALHLTSVNTGNRLEIGFDAATVGSEFGRIQAIVSGIAYKPLSLNPAGGNVGIGTTAPISALHVSNGDVTIDRLLKVGATDSRSIELGPAGQIFSTGDAGGWAFGYYAKGSAGTNRGGFGFTGSADTVTYYYIGAAYNAPTATFTPAGSVGIGTTAPSTKLHVVGDALVDGQLSAFSGVAPFASIKLEGSSTNAVGIQLKNTVASGRSWMLLSSGGTGGTPVGSFSIWDDTALASRLVVDPTGRVGINTTAPAAWLHVNGDAEFNGRVRLMGARTQLGLDGGGATGSHWLTYSNDDTDLIMGFGRVVANSYIYTFKGDIQGVYKLGLNKDTSGAVAPGVGQLTFRVEAGTTAGTLKIMAYAGTSTTGKIVLDNIGAGN